MKAFFTNLVNPFAPADGPPPSTLWAFLRWALRGSGKVIAAAAFFGFLVGMAEAASAWIIGWIVDQALEAGRDGFITQNTMALLAIAGFFIIVRPVLITFAAALNSMSVSSNAVILALSRLNRHTMGQSLRFFEDDFAGRVAQKQLQTSSAIGNILAEVVNSVTFAFSAVIGAMIVLSQINICLALGLAVWFAGYILYVRHFMPIVRGKARARAGARAALSGQIVDIFSNMRTVKLFAHGGREEASAETSMAAFRNRTQDFGATSTIFRGGLAFMAGVLPVLLIGIALVLWDAGHSSAGDIATAGLLSTRIAQMSGWISFVAMGIFANIGEIENGIQTLSPSHDLVDTSAPKTPKNVMGAITFKAVEFAYGRDKFKGGLNNLSLQISPGEKLGLVGRSGAGKSTTLSVLLRLYDIENGAIFLDGINIRDMSQDYLRSQFSVVSQDASMFNRSARDNIAYGNPSATQDQVEQAARAAYAHEFIQSLEDFEGRRGYDAYLGERGVKLSGGQRQRIALARAFLKNAPIILLDEATSALDTQTETLVQAALADLIQTKTVIAIAHRLSTIAKMDRIAVMDNGKISELGTHAQLLKINGLYAAFWDGQSSSRL